MMRSTLVKLHRYVGLTIALFLIITGLSGAIISWDHELDEWLNPHLFASDTQAPALDPLLLLERVEQQYPQIEVTYFELHHQAGHSQYFWVEPRVDSASKELFEPTFNQLFVDPSSGKVQGMREWGQVWPITTETFMSFLYKLHFSLHIPEINGNDHWGIWLLGAIALLWTVDSLVALIVTLPKRKRKKSSITPSWLQRWRKAWTIRSGVGFARFNFDFHRAISLWTWGLLLLLAFTAFSLNLYREVFFPVMSLLSDVTPTPIEQRQPNDHHQPIKAQLSFREVGELAQVKAKKMAWNEPLGSFWYAREYGIYRIEFFNAETAGDAVGVGHKALYFDALDGRYLGDFMPWRGTAADLFVQAQFPLHSGRILGLPGRILISVMGVVIALLAMSGVIIWWRKTSARRHRRSALKKD